MKQILLVFIFCGISLVLKAQIPETKLSAGAEKILKSYFDEYKRDLSDPQNIFGVGYYQIYSGNDAVGNELMEYALSLKDSVTAEDYQELSVQHTKNGNHPQALAALDKAVLLNAKWYGYYGWVLLYYYHEYEKALTCLEKYDDLTPNFSDAPVGEDIHFLKGQCYMQLGQLEKAIAEFDIYISETTKSHGEEWVDAYTFVYKGRCLDRLGKYKQALPCYDKAIRNYKYSTEAFYHKAQTLLKLGRKREVLYNLQQARILAMQNYLYRDVYVEFFEPVYFQDIENAIGMLIDR